MSIRAACLVRVCNCAMLRCAVAAACDTRCEGWVLVITGAGEGEGVFTTLGADVVCCCCTATTAGATDDCCGGVGLMFKVATGCCWLDVVICALVRAACGFVRRRSVSPLTTCISPAVISTTPSVAVPLLAKYRWAAMME